MEEGQQGGDSTDQEYLEDLMDITPTKSTDKKDPEASTSKTGDDFKSNK